VLSKIERSVGTRSQGPQAPVVYECPSEAVAEAIVNAVAHRDYASNASVQVMLFSDRLDVWNPGELPPPLTVERLRVPHPSIPRNPLLADPLFLARYIEKAGTGTLDMIAVFRESGLPEPEFRQDGGLFVQRLWRPVAASLKAVLDSGPGSRPESGSEWWRSRPEWRPEWGPASVHHRIMVAIQKGPLSRSELASALGHTSISRALRRALDDLRGFGFVAYTIPGKPNSRLQRYRAVRRVGKDAE
jgi:predicted HTH transcriptional regulator